MPTIFISYRRNDSQADVGRIYDRLLAHFGREAVFKDVDDIPAGADFREFLNRTLNECKVLLAVIGPNWLNAADEHGNRRLDNPADWVRLEVAEALRREDVIVVPLLVSNAQMPKVDELPPALKELAYRNSREARPDPDFNQDMNRLIIGLDQHFEKAQGSSTRSISNHAIMSRKQFLKWGGLCGVGAISTFGISQVAKNTPLIYYYNSLERLLKTGNWREADHATLNLILRITNRETEGYPEKDNFQDFPCDALRKIDQLWVNASSGRFGFSVQAKIYLEECKGLLGNDFDVTAWDCFIDKIGWRTKEGFVNYSKVIFDTSAPNGHLPYGGKCGASDRTCFVYSLSLISLFSRIEGECVNI